MSTKMTETDWDNRAGGFPGVVAAARGARVATTVCSWKRCIISRFTTSPGGRCRSGSANGTVCGNGSTG